MPYVLKNAFVYIDSKFKKVDISVSGGYISCLSSFSDIADTRIFDFNNYYIFPGLVDVHVHLREPGFLYKETIKTGTMAAAAGGYTAVCSMPNLSPVPDSIENIRVQTDAIAKDAVINVHPYASITNGELGNELVNFDELSKYCIAFSDDGRGVQSEKMMREAMGLAKKNGKIIAAHCEDESLLNSGYIHDGEYAAIHAHRGIPSASEYKQVERDLSLVSKTGCKYHVCHVSTKESVALIRKAKKAGLDVTSETAPHYLVLNDMDINEDGNFKMNPPIRSEADRSALIEGICDGTIDIISTDHAPHSHEEKNRGLKDSLMGVSGIETAFPVLYTALVRKNIITLEKLITLMHDNPGKRFGISNPIEIGKLANLTVFNLNECYNIDAKEFISKGKSTPFDSYNVYGKCKMTICNGNIVWQDI